MDFKPVKDYEGVYEINKLGQVRRIDKGNILKAVAGRNGYYTVALWNKNKGKNFYIHRLLAIAFIENPNNYPTVNHIDGNKLNNDLLNLEWCSYSDNNKHAYKTGLKIVSDNVRDWARKRAIEFNKNRGKNNV